tara:strand:- start:266 stop:523 length:258 start_codon:yes stop_codon:yes gene_type:complete
MVAFMTKKITPRHDLSWYIKWTASYILLIGMALTSLNIQPYNLYFHLVGVTGWFVVGMLWHDRALVFINAVAIFIFLTGILKEII